MEGLGFAGWLAGKPLLAGKSVRWEASVKSTSRLWLVGEDCHDAIALSYNKKHHGLKNNVRD